MAYRYKVLEGEVAFRTRELICQICEMFEIQVLRGGRDQVHILVSTTLEMGPADIMRRVKGRSSEKLFEEFPHLKKRYWGRHFWARGRLYMYFAQKPAKIADSLRIGKDAASAMLPEKESSSIKVS